MKTAISLPDKLYEEAEETAKSLGLPRSQLFAKALEEYIINHNHRSVIDKLNLVYTNENIEVSIQNAGLDSIRELLKNDSW